MRFLKAFSSVLLLLALLVTIDLGLNCLGAAVLQDGVPYHSFLQSKFGLLEHMGITTCVQFFHLFQISLAVTFLVLVWNTVLSFVKVKKGSK